MAWRRGAGAIRFSNINDLEREDLRAVICGKGRRRQQAQGQQGGKNRENLFQAFADEIFRLANEERVKASLPEVERREDVSPVTVIRAQELSELFSHTRPNGEGYMSLMDEYGIQYRWAGENGAKVPATSGPSGMMNGWMNSARSSLARRKISSAKASASISGYSKPPGVRR